MNVRRIQVGDWSRRRFTHSLVRRGLLHVVRYCAVLCAFLVTAGVHALSSVDFILSINPSALTIAQGGRDTTTLTITPQGGFTGAVSLSLEKQDGTPAPAGITLSPTSVTVSGSNPVSQTLTISVDSSVSAGYYSLQVKGTSASLIRTAQLFLAVGILLPGPPSALANQFIPDIPFPEPHPADIVSPNGVPISLRDLVVIFTDSATVGEVNALMRSLPAVIVGGSPLGRMLLLRLTGPSDVGRVLNAQALHQVRG